MVELPLGLSIEGRASGTPFKLVAKELSTDSVESLCASFPVCGEEGRLSIRRYRSTLTLTCNVTVKTSTVLQCVAVCCIALQCVAVSRTLV